MRVRRFLCVSLLLIPYPLLLYAQPKTDSLLNLIKTDKEDTNKINHLTTVGWTWRINNPDSAQAFASRALVLSNKLNFKKGIADAYKIMGSVKQSSGDFQGAIKILKQALDIYTELHNDKNIASVYNNIGISYESTGDYPQSLSYHTKALDIRKKINDKSGMAASYSNIGNIYYDEGNYPDALANDLKALSIDQELGDKWGVASDYGNIGNLYVRLNDDAKAVDYYNKALEMNSALNDKNGIAIDLYNIALVYSNQHKYKEALAYHFKCLQLKLEIKDSAGIAYSYSGIGAIYGYMHNYDSAINYQLRSMKIRTQISDKAGMVSSYGDLGESYKRTGHFPEAEAYLKKSEQLAKEINLKEDLKQTYLMLSSLYDTTKQFQQAFNYAQLYNNLKDSLVNEDKSKEIGKLEAKADYDKQLALQQADADKQALLADANSKKQKLTIIFIGAIALAVAIIAIIILRSLRVTRKQKALIESQKAIVEEQKILVEQQKAIVEEKNKDITDSIHYASRIQQALLTSDDYIGKYLKEYFILFKPRDIVSGDFYWAVAPPPPEGGIEEGYGYETSDPMLYGLLKSFVHEHRSAPTEAENIFWQLVRGKKIEGYKFRRQHIIGPYIADFVCLPSKLIIEIDGLIHELPERKTSDEQRTQYLNNLGFRVMRFTNNEVISKPDEVTKSVLTELQRIPPSGGGGASFLICAGDCTGHGVPGAFMSLLNISMLNEATLEKKIYSPEKILNDVRHHIIKALNPDGSDKGKDGMDCVLISLSAPPPPEGGILNKTKNPPSEGREAKTLMHFACANNPLWIISDPLGERKLTEFTPDKMPVGIQMGTEKPFTLHTAELKRGDCVYIFTDGFADQFGGPKGKKFKYKQLQELLQANAHKRMSSQKEALSDAFESWKGDLHQVDDVLIIGIRV